MLLRFLICYCVVDFYGRFVMGATEAEVRERFFNHGMECSKDHQVTPEEMTMLQKHQLPDNKNIHCLLSCIFKKSNMFDSKGMLDVQSTTSMIEKDYADDQNKQESSKKLIDICKKVNDEKVTDGEDGCDRAVLLYKCFSENGPQLGIQFS